MRYAYPCALHEDEEGGFTVEFPDVPEAITGAWSRREALDLAQDALATALSAYVHARRDIPHPSRRAPGQHLVAVPPVVAAKLSLYQAMRREKMTNVALAAQLGISESAVRKLLDPDRRSHIGQVEAALKALGRALVIEDRAA
jgi:antitoxin HicB